MTDHRLKPAAAKALEQDDASRLSFLEQDHWISYPIATEVGKALDQLATHAKVTRMPGVALVGRPNNGKTTLVGRFMQKHPSRTTDEGVEVPVVYCLMPAAPDEAKFWSALLTNLMVSHRPDAMVRRLQNQAGRVLASTRTRVLIVDEFHHLASSSVRNQEQVLAALKNLSSQLKLCLVLVGTQHLIGALRADEQFATRLRPYVLERWKPDVSYQRLLASFEQNLPLRKPSKLAGAQIAQEIHSRSKETIGGTREVVISAAKEAIRSGEDAITLDIIQSVEVSSLQDLSKMMRKV